MMMKTVNEIELDASLIDEIDSEKKVFSIKKIPVIGILLLILIITFLFSFTLGRYSISISQLLNIFLSKVIPITQTWPATLETVLFKVRVPRIVAAMLVGAALAASGATYQGLFKNPMVSPDILGASAGAGFGAAMGILMSFGAVGIQTSAFIFGLGAVALAYFISVVIGRGNSSIVVLVLTGMVVSTLFSSLTSVTKYLADTDNKLPTITFWLMGGLSSIRVKDILILFIPLTAGFVPLFLVRWKLNVLSFGEEEAQALGIDTKKIRIMIIICSTLLSAASVSIAGMVGWIGLIIPHIARLIVGPNYKLLLPASAIIGATFLLVVDNIARSLLTVEIPLGILTSLIGAPFFLYLLVKGRKGWI
jgi:iron complex transport system permease protein